MSNETEIQSPCIGVCSVDDLTQLCQGCFRSVDEIQAWWDLDNSQKQAVVVLAAEREAAAFD
jgi:uncharacterized protein